MREISQFSLFNSFPYFDNSIFGTSDYIYIGEEIPLPRFADAVIADEGPGQCCSHGEVKGSWTYSIQYSQD